MTTLDDRPITEGTVERRRLPAYAPLPRMIRPPTPPPEEIAPSPWATDIMALIEARERTIREVAALAPMVSYVTRDGVVVTGPMPPEVMREMYFGNYGNPLSSCYCSPTRGMYFGSAYVSAPSHRSNVALRVGALFAVWAAIALLIVLL